ncbi:MAG: MFS transporter [Chloroflexi bacterium]|nr:MFS transporter [Chloroflexota bacterium]
MAETVQSSTARPRLSANERRVVGLVAGAHGLAHMPDLAFAALIALFQVQLGASLTALGAIAGVYALAAGLTSPVGGILSDRLGSRRMLLVYAGLTSFCSFLTAASASLVMLAVTFTVLGLAVGLYHPIGLSFISRTVRARSMAIGYHGMAGNLGAVVAPAMAVFLAGLLNWRAAFVVLGLLALAIGVAVILTRAEEPSYRSPSSASSGGGGGGFSGLRPYLVPLVLILAVNTLGGLVYRGALTFLPKHFELKLHVSLLGMDPVALGGYVTTVALLFAIPGQYTGGNLGERIRREKLLVPCTLLIIPGLALLGFVTGPALLPAGAFFAFFNFMAQPLYTSLIADYSPPRLQGSIFGITFLSAFGFSFIAPPTAGFIADRWGTEWVFRALAGAQAVAAILAIILSSMVLRKARPVKAPAA